MILDNGLNGVSPFLSIAYPILYQYAPKKADVINSRNARVGVSSSDVKKTAETYKNINPLTKKTNVLNVLA